MPTKTKPNYRKLYDEAVENIRWLDALFTEGDFRADHKQECREIRAKVKAFLRRHNNLPEGAE